MKKLILLSLSALSLAGCFSRQDKPDYQSSDKRQATSQSQSGKKSQSSHKSAQASKSQAKSTSKASQAESQNEASSQAPAQSASQTSEAKPAASQASESKPAEEKPAYASWNAAKDAQLDEFMAAWGQDMGQHYLRYSPATQLNFYGVAVPDTLIIPGYQMTPVFNDQEIPMTWYGEGGSDNDYQIVGVYSDMETFQKPPAHLYVMVIHQGQPLVLYTAQNQGNPYQYLYFETTANEQLSQGFANIAYQ
ncbi:hypothetical protein AWM75_00045 [Aerococcus urinaehominis]|uniref:Uncharacterized protein n=1 Tax=Aerococcus urinaehominis TaxID=128944 RepID=A0A0X8FJJ6_9LACT|nr:DUF4767 domain-containing protein [Aerococcus urinaehominis]AMB98477.1 hypothetical protein AWM75_00045 [Aerococcus urinaehominis]SDL81600.1 protein of unknown function [Aerococcus urinaehominis]